MADACVSGTFVHEKQLLEALRQLRAAGQPVEDVLMPYPSHRVDEALDHRRSRLGLVTLAAGLAGGSVALAFQIWTFAVDWPINVGGKPDLAYLAYIPITFEITVLAAGLATVAAFLWRSRLFPGARPKRPPKRTNDDRFAIFLDPGRSEVGAEALRELLARSGAQDVGEWRDE